MDSRVEEDGYISEEDEDYVPPADAGDDEANDLPYDDVDDELVKKSKRKKSKKTGAESPAESSKKVDPEEKQKRMDALWDEFLNDSTPSSSTNTSEKDNIPNVESTAENSRLTANGKKPEEAKTVTEVFDFAGEEVRVERTLTSKETEQLENKEAKKRTLKIATTGTGLANLANYLAKKPKMTALDKSSLDWNQYVKEKGIEDELKSHNRGKGSYLDKMEFLQRADHKQFEKEKQLRNQHRQN